jgi:hypothetical protein
MAHLIIGSLRTEGDECRFRECERKGEIVGLAECESCGYWVENQCSYGREAEEDGQKGGSTGNIDKESPTTLKLRLE